jgi:hypothetical protein
MSERIKYRYIIPLVSLSILGVSIVYNYFTIPHTEFSIQSKGNGKEKIVNSNSELKELSLKFEKVSTNGVELVKITGGNYQYLTAEGSSGVLFSFEVITEALPDLSLNHNGLLINKKNASTSLIPKSVEVYEEIKSQILKHYPNQNEKSVYLHIFFEPLKDHNVKQGFYVTTEKDLKKIFGTPKSRDPITQKTVSTIVFMGSIEAVFNPNLNKILSNTNPDNVFKGTPPPPPPLPVPDSAANPPVKYQHPDNGKLPVPIIPSNSAKPDIPLLKINTKPNSNQNPKSGETQLKLNQTNATFPKKSKTTN